jgi:hypothetical protein
MRKLQTLLGLSSACFFLVVPGVQSAGAVTVYHQWSVTTAGGYVSGNWWVVSGRTYVSGTVKDTGPDGGNPYAQIDFTDECCSHRVDNVKGYNTSQSFAFDSIQDTHLRVLAGAENRPWWKRESAWKFLF